MFLSAADELRRAITLCLQNVLMACHQIRSEYEDAFRNIRVDFEFVPKFVPPVKNRGELIWSPSPAF